MFYNIYRFMVVHGGCTRINAIIKSYRLYLEQVQQQGGEPVLDFTRAWTLVRFFDSDMLQLSTCTRCTGLFVAHAHDSQSNYVCVLCRPPSRAGKTRPSGAKRDEAGDSGSSGKPRGQPPRRRRHARAFVVAVARQRDEQLAHRLTGGTAFYD